MFLCLYKMDEQLVLPLLYHPAFLEMLIPMFRECTLQRQRHTRHDQPIFLIFLLFSALYQNQQLFYLLREHFQHFQRAKLFFQCLHLFLFHVAFYSFLFIYSNSFCFLVFSFDFFIGFSISFVFIFFFVLFLDILLFLLHLLILHYSIQFQVAQ